jgi:hypothetical protein
MTTPLVETERFKQGLGRLDADLMAARALLGGRSPAFGKIRSIAEPCMPTIGVNSSR